MNVGRNGSLRRRKRRSNVAGVRAETGISVEQMRAAVEELRRLPRIKAIRIRLHQGAAQWWWDERKVYRNWGNPEVMIRKPAGFTGAGSV